MSRFELYGVEQAVYHFPVAVAGDRDRTVCYVIPLFTLGRARKAMNSVPASLQSFQLL